MEAKCIVCLKQQALQFTELLHWSTPVPGPYSGWLAEITSSASSLGRQLLLSLIAF
jgi:hypothetical protein